MNEREIYRLNQVRERLGLRRLESNALADSPTLRRGAWRETLELIGAMMQELRECQRRERVEERRAYLVAGVLSGIDFRPADRHPEELLPWARRALEILEAEL